METPLHEAFSGNIPRSCLAVPFHLEPNGGAASPAPAHAGGMAEQQRGPSSVPPYLEELVQEEGEPIRQHLLGHRLCPRGARRRCTLRTKPNLISLHKPASGSGNGKRWGWTSILPPAPRSSGCSACSTTTTRLPVQAGSRMRPASPVLSPCAQLTACHSPGGDREPGDTRLVARGANYSLAQ